jgi:hypothetical protein
MVQLLKLLCGALIGLFQSSARREAEILVLRQQINVLRRMSPKRPALNNADRLLFVWLSRLVPTTLAVLAVVSPETVIRWHRAGFGALSLPQIKSGYIDDAIHQGRAVVGCVRLCAPHVELARLSPAIGGFEQSCSNSRKTKANAAGAARRTQ